MGLIPRAFIDDLLARVDLVELINASVPLKRSGKNYMACCPFHKEKTPSFSVSPEGQFYHCFGCGQSGNAISFLMDYQRMEFVESIESLAARVGVEVPREASSQTAGQHSQNKLLYELMEKANLYYQTQLRQAEDKARAVDYLKSRGLTGQIAKQFQIGYAAPGWNNLINSEEMENYQASHLELSGLTIAKNEEGKQEKALQYDRFRDRIMFPIRDTRGRCIAFGGRVLGDEKPKYLNSPETPIFNKSKELYGLFEARQANNRLKKILVVEGYMDVIALAQMGINNAVAPMGTSLGSDHLHLLFKTVQEVVFCFDGDEAGRMAAQRSLHNTLPFLQDGRQVRFLFLAEGEDPDSMVRKEGPELFQKRVDNAMPLSDFLFDYLGKDIDLESMDGRASLAKLATPLINQMPRGLFYEMMVSRLAEITQLDKAVISQSLESAHQAELEKQQLRETQYQAYNQQQAQPPQPQKQEAEPAGDDYSGYEGFIESQSDIPDFQEYAQGETNTPKPEPRISTVNRIISYLIWQPQLARNLDIPEEVYKLEAHNIDLLLELVNYIRSADTDISTGSIIGHWHNTEEGFLLSSLAYSESLLDDEAIKREFDDALKRLISQFFKQELAKISGNGSEEKERIQNLLQQKAKFENSST